VTTLYGSEPYVPEFCERMAAEAAALVGEDYEMILVNDGSPDASLELALAEKAKNPRVEVVDLSRNFGHWRAMRQGLSLAKGELVYMTDSDLEEAPELLGTLEAARREGDGEGVADVAYAFQGGKRKGGLFERLSGGAFYRLYDMLSDTPLQRNFMTSRVMTRRYVDALMSYPETEAFFPGLLGHAGFRQVAVPCAKLSTSPSSYSLSRKLSLVVDAITAFSHKPLKWIFFLGTSVTLLSGAATAWLVFKRLVLDEGVAGWASLMVSIWLLSGILIFCLGVVGIYLSRIYLEVKHRPFAVIREVHPAVLDASPATTSARPELGSASDSNSKDDAAPP